MRNRSCGGVLLLALLAVGHPMRAQAQEDARPLDEPEPAEQAGIEIETADDAVEVAGADVIDPEAQETAMARALFLDGVEHARSGRFHRAADFFRRAQAMRPTPAVAYNLASALIRIGRLVEGSEVLHWVIRHPGTTSEMLAAAEVTIAQIRPRLARVRLATACRRAARRQPAETSRSSSVGSTRARSRIEPGLRTRARTEARASCAGDC